MARRRAGFRRTGAGRLLLVALRAVFFPVADVFRALVFFLELRADLLTDFFFAFALAFEADFFLVTFFRVSFLLAFLFAFDLPALAVFFFVFFLLVFLDFFPDFFRLAFLLVAFLAVFLLTFFFDFLLDVLALRVAARLREVFFADFFDPRFLVEAFLVAMRVDPGWLEMQPAIIHRRIGGESLAGGSSVSADSRQRDRLRRVPGFGPVLGDDGGVDTAADVEFRRQAGEPGTHAGGQVVEDLVCDGLVESAGVAKRPDVKLQRFQLDAQGFWHVFENQCREIGLAGPGAQTGEFRDPNPDRVVAAGVGVREILERFPGGPRAVVSHCH